MLKTRVTEMLNIEYPIISGAMQWLSKAELAAAVSDAGGLGILASAQFSSGEELRNEIHKAKQLTDKPFGVNINLFPAIRPVPNEEFIEVLIDEGVKVVETSGVRSPEEYVERLHNAGITLIHKVAGVRYAKKAESVGADITTIVGFENGGALGMDDVTTFILVPRAVDEVSIPVIAGGGIGDGRGMAAALALGAEGVVIGTGFMTTKECPMHDGVKQWMVNAKETDTVVVLRSIRNTHRAARNKVAEEVAEMEAKGTPFEEILKVIGGERALKTFEEGNMDDGLAFCGQVVGLANKVVTVKEFIDGMVAQAEEVTRKLNAKLSLA